MITWSCVIGRSSREFPLLKEEIEESEDDDQDNQLKPISNLKHDQGSDYNKNAIVLPNLELPTIDLKCNQGSQDIESQSNVDQSTDNDDITSDCPGFSRTIVPSQAYGFRNIQGTISDDLEVYGEVDMSPISDVAQSFPHMHRHLPNSLNQESSMHVCMHNYYNHFFLKKTYIKGKYWMIYNITGW